MQTDPPPSTTFSINAGLYDIYDAYRRDYSVILQKEREKEKKREREKERDKPPSKGKVVSDYFLNIYFLTFMY